MIFSLLLFSSSVLQLCSDSKINATVASVFVAENEQARLNCSCSEDQLSTWYQYRITEPIYSFATNPNENVDEWKYSVIRDTDGQYDLIIKNITRKDSGPYTCRCSSKSGSDKNTTLLNFAVTVLPAASEVDPQCHSITGLSIPYSLIRTCLVNCHSSDPSVTPRQFSVQCQLPNRRVINLQQQQDDNFNNAKPGNSIGTMSDCSTFAVIGVCGAVAVLVLILIPALGYGVFRLYKNKTANTNKTVNRRAGDTNSSGDSTAFDQSDIMAINVPKQEDTPLLSMNGNDNEEIANALFAEGSSAIETENGVVQAQQTDDFGVRNGSPDVPQRVEVIKIQMVEHLDTQKPVRFSGLAWMDDKIYLSSFGSNTIYVFAGTSPFHPLPSINLPSVVAISDLSACNFENKLLLFFINSFDPKLDGHSLESFIWKCDVQEGCFGAFRFDGKILKLSSTLSGELLVLNQVKTDSRYFVSIHEPEQAKMIHNIELPPSIFRPEQVAKVSNGNLLVTHHTNLDKINEKTTQFSVSLIDFKTETITKTWDSFLSCSNEDEFFIPGIYTIAIDRHGRLFVTNNMEHGIVMINLESGKFCGILDLREQRASNGKTNKKLFQNIHYIPEKHMVLEIRYPVAH